MPDNLSSAPVLRDVDNGGGWSNSPRAMIVSHVTDDVIREETGTNSLDTADHEKLHAEPAMASGSQMMTPMLDDISSAPALCDAGTGGE